MTKFVRAHDTIVEISALRVAAKDQLVYVGDVPLVAWLDKIAAHAEADELEKQRLRATIMLDARGPGGERLFTGEMVTDMLDLVPNWRMAPGRARQAARLMPPRSICGATHEAFDDIFCHRANGHRGEHCPAEVDCGVDHDKENHDG